MTDLEEAVHAAERRLAARRRQLLLLRLLLGGCCSVLQSGHSNVPSSADRRHLRQMYSWPECLADLSNARTTRPHDTHGMKRVSIEAR